MVMNSQSREEHLNGTVNEVWDKLGWRYIYDAEFEQWSREDFYGQWDWDELQESVGALYTHPPLKVGDVVDSWSKLDSLPLGASLELRHGSQLTVWTRCAQGWRSETKQCAPHPSSELHLSTLEFLD